MHVLTKIFIVIVALLSVMLVPLVVVYAKNEGNYRARYIEADELRASRDQALANALSTYETEKARMQNEITALQTQLAERRREVGQKDATIAQLQSEVATTKSMQSQINSKLAVLVSANEAAQRLVDQLVAEAKTLRDETVQLSRAYAELETSNREQGRVLEVTEAMVRSLQEEVQRLEEANASAQDSLAQYRAMAGDLGGPTRQAPVPVPKRISSQVISVTPSGEGTVLAEINAGQRDGIREGMVLTLTNEQGGYIGQLRIITVDVNRSIGIATTAAGEPVQARVGYGAQAIPD